MFYKQPFEMKSRVHTFFNKQSMYLGYLFIDIGEMSMICKGIYVKPIQKCKEKSHTLVLFELNAL